MHFISYNFYDTYVGATAGKVVGSAASSPTDLQLKLSFGLSLRLVKSTSFQVVHQESFPFM